MSQIKTMIFLLLATLAFALPTSPYTTQDTLSVLPQDLTATAPTVLSIPTITLDILQPPFVSLYSLAARDGQEVYLTKTGTPDLTSTTTTTTTEIPTSTIMTSALQTATSSTVLQAGTETPVATSSLALHSETEVSAPTSSSGLNNGTETSVATLGSVQQTRTEVPVATSTDSGHAPIATVRKAEWDCTALCGELDKDGECTSTVGCVAIGDGSEKVKGMKPPRESGAGSSGVCKEWAGAVFVLVVLVRTLL